MTELKHFKFKGKNYYYTFKYENNCCISNNGNIDKGEIIKADIYNGYKKLIDRIKIDGNSTTWEIEQTIKNRIVANQ